LKSRASSDMLPFSLCNMAAPPSLNLLGEIGLLSRLVS